jgi:hypothetical protein
VSENKENWRLITTPDLSHCLSSSNSRDIRTVAPKFCIHNATEIFHVLLFTFQSQFYSLPISDFSHTLTLTHLLACSFSHSHQISRDQSVYTQEKQSMQSQLLGLKYRYLHNKKHTTHIIQGLFGL